MFLDSNDIRTYFPLYTEEGALQVSVFTGGGAFPLLGARITVYILLPDGTEKPIRVLYTGQSGQTELLALPAPSKKDSLTPDSNRGGPPYATYKVTAEASGYYPAAVNRVPVFAGITSGQSFQLVPLANDTANGPIRGIDIYSSEEDKADIEPLPGEPEFSDPDYQSSDQPSDYQALDEAQPVVEETPPTKQPPEAKST